MLIDRLVHSCEFDVLGRGCKAKIYFDVTTKKWILKEGATVALTCTNSVVSTDRMIRDREQAEKFGYIVDGVVNKELSFQSLSAITQFILLRPNSYVGVYYPNSKILLKDILLRSSLYNKYIAKCKYYDENWNTVCRENSTIVEDSDTAITNQENTPITETTSITEELTAEITTSDAKESTTSLSNYNTSEIFKEILTRMINNIG